MTTAAFTSSLSPGVAGRCGRVRANSQDSVSEGGSQRARLEDHIEYFTGRAFCHLEGERARAGTFRRGGHKAPAGLLGDGAQRVEDRPSRLVDRNSGSVVGKTTRQPAAVRRGGSGDA